MRKDAGRAAFLVWDKNVIFKLYSNIIQT